MSETKTDIRALLAEGRKLLETEEYEFVEFIPKLFQIHDYVKQGPRTVGTYPCGSVSFDDTPKTLYRALFLFKPDVSFKDMYKSTILTIVSPDYGLVAEFDLFKYEAALYFQASEEHVDGKRQYAVQGGSPGTDNGIHYKSEVAKEWFLFLKELLSREWMVYGGNDFAV